MPLYRRPKSRKVSGRRPSVRASKNVARRRNTYQPYDTSKGTNPSNHVTVRGIGFPDTLSTTLVYADSFLLASSAGTPCPYKVYNLASVYDPDAAIGGGQPTYFDQLAVIYGRYKVVGAKITATFNRGTTAAANLGPWVCGVQTGDPTISSTSAGSLISSPNTGWKLVSQDSASQTVVATYSAKNTFPDQMDNIQARVTGNPAIGWYGKVFATPQGVTVATDINCVVIIEYRVVFSEVNRVVDA